MEISGKAALVLGASRGIGLAIARTLAGHGVHLALPWFDWPESAAAMAEEFAGGFGRRVRTDWAVYACILFERKLLYVTIHA